LLVVDGPQNFPCSGFPKTVDASLKKKYEYTKEKIRKFFLIFLLFSIPIACTLELDPENL